MRKDDIMDDNVIICNIIDRVLDVLYVSTLPGVNKKHFGGNAFKCDQALG